MSLLAALGRRLLRVVPILLLASALLFAVLRPLPAGPEGIGPVEPEQSWPAQYATWLGRALGGDWGWSVQLRRPVGAVLAEALPATIELALLATAVAGGLGLAGGLLLFALRGGEGAAVAETATALMMSVPDFLLALLFLLVFGVLLEAMPVAGRLDPALSRPVFTGFLLLDTLLARDLRAFGSAVQHMALPALALGIAVAPSVMRVLRAALIAVYQADHIRQARLRGVPEGDVLLAHALGHAARPALALMGMRFGVLFGGALLVEAIFSYPGIGRLMVEAVRTADLPILQAAGLACCAVVLLVHALADGLGLVLDPRGRPR